jgi:hypothetical protein
VPGWMGRLLFVRSPILKIHRLVADMFASIDKFLH